MKKILVIEDNEDNLYLISFILRKNGHAVIEAKSGLQGIKIAVEEKPDLILMDIQLPDIDGLEATRRIRASDTNITSPIVAVTSYAMIGDREKAIRAGCTDYIEKPINPETIMEKIKKYLL